MNLFKYSGVVLLSSILTLTSCKDTGTGNGTDTNTATQSSTSAWKTSVLIDGRWINSSGTYPNYLGNSQYLLEVKNDSEITISLSSGSDTVLYVLNTQTLEVIKENNDQSLSNTNSQISLNLVAGNYFIVAATTQFEVNDDFELTVDSSVANSIQVTLDRAGNDDGTPVLTAKIAEDGNLLMSESTDPHNESLELYWNIYIASDYTFISNETSINTNDYNYVGEYWLELFIRNESEHTSWQNITYDFGSQGIDNEIANISGTWLNSGEINPTDPGNDFYKLDVLQDAKFLIEPNSETNANFYILNSEQEVIDNSMSRPNKTPLGAFLTAGTYYITVDSAVINTAGDYGFTLFSNVENAANITLDFDGIDTGVQLAAGELFINDYIGGATICIDENENGKCDDSEFSSTTAENGLFTIRSSTLSDGKQLALNNYPIIAQIPATATMFGSVDSFGYELVLTAPVADFTKLSPMSSLIRAYMLKFPEKSQYDTQVMLLELMNLTDSSYNDLTSGLAPSEDQAQFNAVTHIISLELGQAYDSIESNNAIISKYPEKQLELLAYLSFQMIDQLTDISNQVATIIQANGYITQAEIIVISDLIDSNQNVNDLTVGLSELSVIFNKTIHINTYGDYGNYFDEFYDDITLQTSTEYYHEPNNWGTHHNKLRLTLSNNAGAADIELIDTGMVGGFNQSDALLDLTAQFAPYKDDMVAYAVAQGQNAQGQQLAIPVDLGPGVAFYRRDYMEDLGFDIDTVMVSFDSWITYGETLRDEHGIFLVSNADGIARALYYSNVDAGDGVYTGPNNEILVESDRFKDAFKLAKRLRDEGLDADTGMWNDKWYSGFRNGAFAMEIQGAWMLGHLQGWIAPDTAGLWGASNLPNGIYGAWGGTFAAIPTQSVANKDLAWGVIEYMISADAQLNAFENWAMFPANTNTYSQSLFEEPIDFLNGQAARVLFAEIAEKIEPVTPGAYDNIAETLTLNALRDVLDDGRDIDEALEQVAADLAARMAL
ncbi:MAG: extracellular solute-binding protein [Saccharospirillaceae bacterium]|nr:extracellular solute-binding protein [Pseudomonadales bacterium]NRB78725.1 extracellular solute-binding protein [Saccharospirillaceae bacterium]